MARKTLRSIKVEDPTARANLLVAERYLSDNNGVPLELEDNHIEWLSGFVLKNYDTRSFSNNDLAVMNAIGFTTIQNDLRVSTMRIQQEMRAVGSLVADCHADTVQKLSVLQANLQQVSDNVSVLGTNVASISNDLLQLRREFNEYVRKDVLANNVQLAKHDLTQINQELERQFGHNRELRRTAVGILQANDLNVRTDTILTRTEELCLSTPNYWLAPALVSLADWIVASRALAAGKAANDREVQEAMDGMKRMLTEAYLRECSKTALFFGLISRRANNISLANEWFKEYISFQDPRRVDYTCVVLLNAYAGGVMGRGPEEQEILDIMARWVDELLDDADDKYERRIVEDWKNTCIELYQTGKPSSKTYQALPEFCAEIWPAMQASMQATNIHREMKLFLERELAKKDFAEDDVVLIDAMIADLVTQFDGDELPLQRQREYQQLIVDLNGDRNLAEALRSVKDDILTETKTFTSILSDAARNADLSHASAAAHVYALKIQMPQIKKAYEEVVQDYRDATPQVIPFTVGDFQATTTDGSNEEECVQAFVSQVNQQEKSEIAKNDPNPKKIMAIVGGAIAVVGLILTFVMGVVGVLLLLVGLGLGGYGLFSYRKAHTIQEDIQKEMQRKRTYGTLVIRKIMAEVRDWRNEYSVNESTMSSMLKAMDQQSAHMSEFNVDDA